MTPTSSFLLAAAALSACVASQSRAIEAEDAYRAQQMKCVEQHATRAAIALCRGEVKKSWGRDAGDGD